MLLLVPERVLRFVVYSFTKSMPAIATSPLHRAIYLLPFYVTLARLSADPNYES